MGDFEPVGAERHRQFDDLVETVEILPVHDRVHRQRQPGFADEARRPALGLLGAGKPGNAVAGDRVGILEAELDVLEPGLDEFRSADRRRGGCPR